MKKVREKLIFSEIPTLPSDDLLYWGAELKSRVTRIQGQIENWRSHLTPEIMDDDWRDKAQKALNVNRDLLGQVKLEQTRRRVAMGSASPTSRGHAFVRAAKVMLDKDTIRQIWIRAAELYPECFEYMQPTTEGHGESRSAVAKQQ